ncbi:hypothetical protein ACTXT7_004858 [Hymenolepis weldensis]
MTHRDINCGYYMVRLAASFRGSCLTSPLPCCSPRDRFPFFYSQKGKKDLFNRQKLIFASDPDAGENATLVYRIRAGDPFDMFQLDSRTGDLSVAKDYSSTGQYMGQYLLFLEASDCGSPRRFSEAQLLIHMDDSEPLGRVERDIFGFPIRSAGRGVAGASSRSMNLYIIAAIIVASFVISSVLLVAICLVVRRARTLEHGQGGRYPGDGGNGLQNGSIFHDGGLGNGYLKSVPLSLPHTKYTTCDPLEEDYKVYEQSSSRPNQQHRRIIFQASSFFKTNAFEHFSKRSKNLRKNLCKQFLANFLIRHLNKGNGERWYQTSCL